MSNLIHPQTRQPCAFVASLRNHVCLRLTCTVSPAVQWFPIEAIESVNPVYTVAEPPQPLTFVLLPEMVGTISHAIGVTLVYPQPPDDAYVVQPAPVVVRKPAPVISLYADALRAA